jgi:hypothetical protein
MTQKFGRNYRLTVSPLDGSAPILITMPFTMNFHLERSNSSFQNSIDIQVLNLSETHRKQIYMDWFNFGGVPVNNNLTLEAGYSNLNRIFDGVMYQASSAREGTNIVTRIKGFANNTDITNTQTFQTLQSGQTLGQVLQFLIAQFPNLKQGNELNYPEVFKRPVVLNGFTWNLLKQYSNANVYIDNGKVYILRNNEALDNISIINDDTGILETPRREQGALYVTTLFEPLINVGQIVQIQSSVQPSYNGSYRVNRIAHRGTISGAVCGKLVTQLELLAPNPFNGYTTVNQL